MDMLGTSTLLYGGTGTSKATVGDSAGSDKSNITYDLVRKMSRILVANRAKKVTQMVTGSRKVDTRTVNASYYAIIGPEVKKDLESLSDSVVDAKSGAWIPVHSYADASNIAEGEVGAMHDIRFIESERMFVDKGAGAKITGTIGDAKVQYTM